MAGDRIHTKVDYYYANPNANNNTTGTLSALVNSLVSSITNTSVPSALVKGSEAAVSTQLGGNVVLDNFLNPTPSTNPSNPGQQAPKAYLCVLFFDEQMKFDATSSRIVKVDYLQGGVSGTIDRMFSNAVPVGKNGYAYVYFTNESDELVYFDHFMLSHERGPLLEESHYYPFGLTMAGISSKAAGGMQNRYKFNDGTELENKEFSDGSGLELYATEFRSYDPQIGRFHQMDELADYYENWSPYVFGYDNPISFNDPLGLSASDSVANPSPLPPPETSTAENPKVLPEVVVVSPPTGKSSTPLNAPITFAEPAPVIPYSNLRPIPGGQHPSNVQLPQQFPLWIQIGLRTVGTIGLVLYPVSGPEVPYGDELHYQRPLFDPFYSPGPADTKDENNWITLYRGVHAGHPDIMNARFGRAVPFGLNGGHDDPRVHNAGNNNSVYTSWSVYKNVAANFAGRRGWGGVILTKRFHKSRITLSPDKFKQGEVLIWGIVDGARVENARPTNLR